jgi:Capsular polysaccharide synthesis protein
MWTTSKVILSAADKSPRAVQKRLLLEVLSNWSSQDLGVRTQLLEWALGQEPNNLDLGKPKPDFLNSSPSFTYWNTPLEDAPPIVQACLVSQLKHLGNSHRVMDDRHIAHAISMPSTIITKRDCMSTTHYSDVIRLCLLAQYGGVWLDATVFLSGPIEDSLRSSEFFAYTRPHDPYLISSWFLAAERSNYLILRWLELLVQYWREFNQLVDYFLLHHLFEILVLTDRRFRQVWSSMPERSFLPPHVLQSRLLSDFNITIIEEAYRQTPIHKLTYKYEQTLSRFPSVADFICANSRIEEFPS